MATNGNRRRSATRNPRASGGRVDGPGPARADLVALYNANCDIARDYVRTTLEAAEQLHAIGVEQGEQAIALAGKTAAAFAAADAAQGLALQTAVAQQALGETLRYLERVATVSVAARSELLLLLDRQYRLNGVPGGLTHLDLLGEAAAARASAIQR